MSDCLCPNSVNLPTTLDRFSSHKDYSIRLHASLLFFSTVWWRVQCFFSRSLGLSCSVVGCFVVFDGTLHFVLFWSSCFSSPFECEFCCVLFIQLGFSLFWGVSLLLIFHSLWRNKSMVCGSDDVLCQWCITPTQDQQISHCRKLDPSSCSLWGVLQDDFLAFVLDYMFLLSFQVHALPPWDVLIPTIGCNFILDSSSHLIEYFFITARCLSKTLQPPYTCLIPGAGLAASWGRAWAVCLPLRSASAISSR